MTVLDLRALNRATLARQLLLNRADLPVHDAVSRLGGLQAQEPQEPFVGLWSRLRGFDPATLSALLTQRRVVRAHLMRRTVHLVTSEDYLGWRARHAAMLRQRVLGVYRRELTGVDPDALAVAGRAVLADGQPRSMPDLGRAVADRWPEAGYRALGELLVAVLPLIQLPPRGLWRTTAGVRHALVCDWLGREVDPLPPEVSDPVGQVLVRRYLAAYGPAATADLRAWCGLAGLPAAVKEVRGELVAFRDQRGRELLSTQLLGGRQIRKIRQLVQVLLDLPDAPRPDADTPAPVRFLPAFDNALLGYDDRSRIVADAHRGLSVNGVRVVLVDGWVAASWTVEGDMVVVTPLRRLTRAEREEIAEEGRAVAAFLAETDSPEAGSGRVHIVLTPEA